MRVIYHQLAFKKVAWLRTSIINAQTYMSHNNAVHSCRSMDAIILSVVRKDSSQIVSPHRKFTPD